LYQVSLYLSFFFSLVLLVLLSLNSFLNNKHKIQPNTYQQTRQRLAAALQNRNLLKSIGEYEEYQPVEARPIREIRSIFECLGSHGYHLGDNTNGRNKKSGGNSTPRREPPGLAHIFGVAASKVIRTEKVGSGGYTSLVQQPLQTGFPQLDSYGSARREIAFTSFDSYYRRIKVERKKRIEKFNNSNNNNNVETSMMDEADAAARDAVRCLEHAMITVAGEKNVYKHIVTPALQQTVDDEDDDDEDGENGPNQMSPYFGKACAASYAYVVAAVVDRTLDIIETVFLKEGGIGQAAVKNSTGDGSNPALTVPVAASAAAAGLRMLDGVRMLGPSLAKLCEMQVGDGTTNANSSLSATLCIAIHRTTVKNTARTLENLAKAIQEDPLKGPYHRPKDASVSSVSRDVVRAIRLISPFVSAYKSVSKRRALPWDPNMGDSAGELDSFVRYLVMRLLNSLKGMFVWTNS
jgi:exocyst complex component 7